jgi:hypothetical protein
MKKPKSSFKAGNRGVELPINTKAMSTLTRLKTLKKRTIKSVNRMSLWMTKAKFQSLLKTKMVTVRKILRNS